MSFTQWDRTGKVVTALFLVFMAAACGSSDSAFYYQALEGQVALLSRSVPIEEILADPQADPVLKLNLQLATQGREFAREVLRLPVGGNFQDYVDVPRDRVVYNVFAAPEFSLTPKQWCYPYIGCLGYRGFFSESDANIFANSLKLEGYDVYSGGSTAFSTLGLFDDPILSTFFSGSDISLIRLIFHEIAHKELFVAGDTVFNESFATAVELEGLRVWSENYPEFNSDLITYQQSIEQREEFVAMVLRLRARLSDLYDTIEVAEREGQEVDYDSVRLKKAQLIEQIKAEQFLIESNWAPGSGSFYYWVLDRVNNAKVNTVATYYDFVPAFLLLIESLNFDLTEFYTVSEQLGAFPKEERHALITQITSIEAAQQVLAVLNNNEVNRQEDDSFKKHAFAPQYKLVHPPNCIHKPAVF